MKQFTFKADITEEDVNYLENSASIRRTSVSKIVRRIVETVIRDRLILSVLDDESKPSPGKTYVKAGRIMAGTLSTAVTIGRSSYRTPSKAELQAQLAEAARNTAAMQSGE